MAYVEWHGAIRNHYKTERLMRALSIPRWQAVGVLGTLVAWTIDTRPGGRMERELVPIAIEWDGDADILVAALLESGWLEPVDDNGFVKIHDWHKVTRGYRKSRADAARRTRDRRAVTALQKRSDGPERSGTSRNQKRLEGEGASSPLAPLLTPRRRTD